MGAYTELVDFTFTANETSRTFSGLSITKDDFVKVVFTHSIGNLNSFLSIFPNNETTATNYHAQTLTANGSSVSSARVNVARVGDTIGNNVSTITTFIKLSENDRYNAFSNGNHRNDSSIRVQFLVTTSSGVTFTSGITSLTFTASETNGIGTGSRIQIYKLDAVKVADITVTSNTTQVDISNLSIDKDSEYLLVTDLTAGGSNSNINITPNDLTTATNYFAQRIIGNATAASGERGNFPRFFGATANTKTVAYTHIKLSNIGAFTYQSYQLLQVGSSSPLIINEFGSSTAENITSITKLNLIAQASNGITSGTRFELYKLYE